MPKFQINQKGYAASQLRHQEINLNHYVQDANWFTNFCNLCTPKTRADFEKHIGRQSTYNAKPMLLHSLKFHYAILSGALNALGPVFNLSNDQKSAVIAKINEGIDQCTPGFHSRVNNLLEGYFRPQNIDELISWVRQDIVERTANQKTDEVHANNRFFIVAKQMGFAVHPKLENDPYRGALYDFEIEQALRKAFATEFQPFTTLLKLKEMILSSFDSYVGYKKKGYTEATYGPGLDYLMKLFNEPERRYDYLIQDEETSAVCDINWDLILGKLWKDLIQKRYFESSTLLGHGVAHWSPWVRKLTKPFEKQNNKKAIALITNLFEDPNTPHIDGIAEIAELFSTPSECFAYLQCNPNLPNAVKATLLLSYLKRCYAEDPAYNDYAFWQFAAETPDLADEFGSRVTIAHPEQLATFENQIQSNLASPRAWMNQIPTPALLLKLRYISTPLLGKFMTTQDAYGENGLMKLLPIKKNQPHKMAPLITLLNRLDHATQYLSLQQQDTAGRNAFTHSLMNQNIGNSAYELIRLIESLPIEMNAKIAILKLNTPYYDRNATITLALQHCPAIVPLLLPYILHMQPNKQQIILDGAQRSKSLFNKNQTSIRFLLQLSQKTLDLRQQATYDTAIAKAAKASMQLQTTLITSLADYTKNPKTPEAFSKLQETWQKAINTARKSLKRYSDWNTFLANVTLVIISIPLIGIPLALNYYQSKQKYVFFQTESVRQLDKLETVIHDEPTFLAGSIMR